MKLKEALKTKGFQSDFQEAFLNVLFTASWFKCAAKRRFKPFGLSPEQYNVLRILRGSQPQALSVKEIGDRMVDRSSNTTRIIDKLEQKGWVARFVNPDNRRAVQISLTATGTELLASLDQLPLPATLLSQAEARQLSDLLDKMRESVS